MLFVDKEQIRKEKTTKSDGTIEIKEVRIDNNREIKADTIKRFEEQLKTETTTEIKEDIKT